MAVWSPLQEPDSWSSVDYMATADITNRSLVINFGEDNGSNDP